MAQKKLSPGDVTGLAILAQHRRAHGKNTRVLIRQLGPTAKRIANVILSEKRPSGVTRGEFKAGQGFVRWAQMNKSGIVQKSGSSPKAGSKAKPKLSKTKSAAASGGSISSF